MITKRSFLIGYNDYILRIANFSQRHLCWIYRIVSSNCKCNTTVQVCNRTNHSIKSGIPQIKSCLVTVTRQVQVNLIVRQNSRFQKHYSIIRSISNVQHYLHRNNYQESNNPKNYYPKYCCSSSPIQKSHNSVRMNSYRRK